MPQFSTREGMPRTLLVTSARPGEGKSTTAFALAAISARLGLRVLLIDADLRRSSRRGRADAASTPGLSSYLAGAAGFDEVLQQRGASEPSLIPAGATPPDPVELISGPRLSTLLAEAAERFELVIVDSPPVMGIADATLLASVAEGTLLVVQSGATRTGAARLALGRLRSVNARLVGCVLSKFDARRAGLGGELAYGYRYDRDAERRLGPAL